MPALRGEAGEKRRPGRGCAGRTPPQNIGVGTMPMADQRLLQVGLAQDFHEVAVQFLDQRGAAPRRR